MTTDATAETIRKTTIAVHFDTLIRLRNFGTSVARELGKVPGHDQAITILLDHWDATHG